MKCLYLSAECESEWKYFFFFFFIFNGRGCTYYENPKKICCKHPKICTRWPCHRIICPKRADRMEKQCRPRSDCSSRSSSSSSLILVYPLIWVYTVCPDLTVRKLRIITVTRSAYIYFLHSKAQNRERWGNLARISHRIYFQSWAFDLFIDWVVVIRSPRPFKRIVVMLSCLTPIPIEWRKSGKNRVMVELKEYL